MKQPPAAKDLLSFKDLVRLGYVSNRVTLTRRIKAGDFPAPIKTGPRSVAWLSVDLAAWLAARIRARPIGAAQDQAAPSIKKTGRAGREYL